MKHWQPHSQVAANPPFQRARDVHQLHFAQSVPTIHAEDSALRRNMPQHNNENEEALKKRRLTFAHSCSGVGSMGRSWIDIVRTSRTAENHHG